MARDIAAAAVEASEDAHKFTAAVSGECRCWHPTIKTKRLNILSSRQSRVINNQLVIRSAQFSASRVPDSSAPTRMLERGGGGEGRQLSRGWPLLPSQERNTHKQQQLSSFGILHEKSWRAEMLPFATIMNPTYLIYGETQDRSKNYSTCRAAAWGRKQFFFQHKDRSAAATAAALALLLA